MEQAYREEGQKSTGKGLRQTRISNAGFT